MIAELRLLNHIHRARFRVTLQCMSVAYMLPIFLNMCNMPMHKTTDTSATIVQN